MKPTTPTTAARRQRRRVAHWLARAVTEALRLGAGPAELRALTGVAAALRVKSAESDPTTATSPRP